MRTAIDCFARYGYTGTSIERIARDAGVTKGALYYHFRDKEELLFEAVRERVADFERAVLEQVGPLANPVAALREIARICAHSARADNHRRFVLTLMVEALDTNAELSAQFRTMMRRFRGFCRDLVARGQTQGLFRDDLEAGLVAQTFVGGILGTEMQYYQDPDSIDLAASLETHVDQFLTWIGRPGTARCRVSGGNEDV